MKELKDDLIMLRDNVDTHGYGKALAHHIGMTAYEKLGEINVSAAVNTDLQSLLKRSYFNSISAKMIYALAISTSDDFGLAKITRKGKEYILMGKVIEKVHWLDDYDLFTLQSSYQINAQVTFDEKAEYEDVSVCFRFKANENGKGYTEEQIYYDKTNEPHRVPKTEIKVHDTGVIPAQIFKNNELNVSDIEMLLELFNSINFFDNKLIEDNWKHDVAFVLNRAFNNDIDLDSIKNDIETKGGIALDDVDGQLGDAAGIFNAGSNLPLTYLQTLQFFEDKILKFSGSMREISTTGTNKMNSEVLSQNQKALEYLVKKLNFQAEQYERFFTKITGEEITVSIDLPILEKLKFESIKSSVELSIAQADDFHAAAELKRSKVKNPNISEGDING